MALLARGRPALTLRYLRALGPGHVLTLLPLHGLALPLIHVLALLPGHLPALLLRLLLTVLLAKVALGADFLVHSVAFPLVGGGALLARDILK